MQRPFRFALLALLGLVFLASPSAIRFYTDWLWFGEVGYQQVFLTVIRAQSILFVVAFAVAAVWLAANLRLALASISRTSEVPAIAWSPDRCASPSASSLAPSPASERRRRIPGSTDPARVPIINPSYGV